MSLWNMLLRVSRQRFGQPLSHGVVKTRNLRTLISLPACGIPGNAQRSAQTLSRITILPFRSCPCRKLSTQTDGDKDLIHFLQEEMAYEQENITEPPKFRDFEVEIVGTHVSLRRIFNGEEVEVSFNLNENVNVDEGCLEDEEASMEDVENQPDIISYPQFHVTIKKPSGRTLDFNCTCNNINDEENGEGLQSEQDEQFELFRFDNLKIYTEGAENKDQVYEAETENMDGELYSMLMTTLLERGITGTFVNDLLELSTATEHKQYLQFLKDLQRFIGEK